MFLILFRNTWGPYLYANSFLDDNQLAKAQKQADICQHYADIGSWDYATECWGTMEQLIGTETSDVSWYNILKYGGQDDWSITRTKRSKEEALGKIMTNNCFAKLNWIYDTDISICSRFVREFPFRFDF